MSTEARCWYLNQKGKAAGPFTFSDLKLMAAEGDLKGHDLVYREGSNEWKRAYDWPEIVAECFADENHSSISRLIRLPEDERAVDDQWVLLVREDGEKEVRFRQKGPFQADEIRRMLAEDEVKVSDHIWKKGAARWVPLFDVPEFKINNQKMTKEAEHALSQVESMPNLAEAPPSLMPEKQSVREWALGIVKSAEENGELPTPAVSKAQIYVPEVTQAQVEAKFQTPEPEPELIPSVSAVDFNEESEEERTEYVPSLPAQPVEPEVIARESVAPPVNVAKPAYKQSVQKRPAPLQSEHSPYDFEPPKTLFSKLTPVFGVLVIGVFGVGFWATVNTDRSALQPNANLTYQVQPVAPSAQQDSNSNVSTSASLAPPTVYKNDHDPNMRKTESSPAPTNTPSHTTPPPQAPASTAVAVKPGPVPASASSATNPAHDFDGKNPQVRVNEAETHLEILGPFKKSDLLRIRLEGKAGQILDMPGLVQKYEVRATQDSIYHISLRDARIPKGEYFVSVQFGVSRFNRGLSYGKDAEFSSLLTAHRKMISYEQQQEKKRLIKAAKELASLVAQAEGQVQNQAALKKIIRDMDKKAPKEMRQVRTNRYQLFFGESWEKLAAQWEKTQTTLKENPARNPASVAEFVRTKRAASTLESEVRNMSIWE